MSELVWLYMDLDKITEADIDDETEDMTRAELDEGIAELIKLVNDPEMVRNATANFTMNGNGLFGSDGRRYDNVRFKAQAAADMDGERVMYGTNFAVNVTQLIRAMTQLWETYSKHAKS